MKFIKQIISDLAQLGPIGNVILLTMNIVILFGLIQIVSVGWSSKVHCSVDSSTVNITKWSDSAQISRYSATASFRVDSEVFSIEDYEITSESLQELLEGTGDTNKQRSIIVNITHLLFPVSSLPEGAKPYGCVSSFIGHAYQNCYLNYGEYYFSKPPDQDASIIVMVGMLILLDMLFITLYRFTKMK